VRNEILWILCTGAPWADVPDRCRTPQRELRNQLKELLVFEAIQDAEESSGMSCGTSALDDRQPSCA
jgi:hypothetical protein